MTKELKHELAELKANKLGLFIDNEIIYKKDNSELGNITKFTFIQDELCVKTTLEGYLPIDLVINKSEKYDKLPFSYKSKGRGGKAIYDKNDNYICNGHNDKDMDFILKACNSCL